MIPSKRSPVWTFGVTDQMYIGTNKNYFDRGAYARKWPRGNTISGYVNSTAGNQLAVFATFCDTLLPVPGTAYGYDVLASSSFRWWIKVPQANVANRAFYVEVYCLNASNFVERLIYQNVPGGAYTNITPFGAGKGVIVRMPENAIAKRALIPVGVNVNANPILTRLYSVDPHNQFKKTLIKSASTSALIGTVGDQTLQVDIESSYPWNPGDLMLIVAQTQGADVIFVQYRDVGGDFDANSWYYDEAFNSYNPYVYLPGASVVGYEALRTELIRYSDDQLTMIKSRNLRIFDMVPSNQEVVTWIAANFWQQSFPQEMEDIEVLPGEFTRLRNEQYRKRKLETEFQPGFRHEQIQTFLSVDEVTIDATKVIMRDPYEFQFNNRHFGLAKGSVLLTEQPTILRNVI